MAVTMGFPEVSSSSYPKLWMVYNGSYDLGVFPDLPCDRAWLRVFRQACPRKVFELDIEDTIQVSLVVVPLKGENMA